MSSMKNQAFVFIKPHAVTDAVKDRVSKTLGTKGCKIVSEGSLTSEVIDEKRLIDKHYYAIATKATLKKPHELNVPADKFKVKFGIGWQEALDAGKVFNALDACEKLEITAEEMDTQWGVCKKADKLIKFGGGFYCGLIEIKNKDPIYVFNGFFMAMRNKYCAPGLSIYYYLIEWDAKKLSWKDFREKVLGPTDPQDAPKDSLRGLILQRWKELGLSEEPNVGDNGVHASASPFEGLAERLNWVGASIKDDAFGQALLSAGIDEAWIKDGANDPQVDLGEGKKGSLFDAVEDTDAEECVGKLTALATRAGAMKSTAVDIWMWILMAGVLGSFTIFGYAQEAVTRSTFGADKERFSFTTFLVLLQSIGNCLVAVVFLLFQSGGKMPNFSGGVPVQEWLLVAAAYLGAHEMGLAALKFIIFPLQVVCKSCKAIPVMVGEMIFDPEKKHSLGKKLSVILMCAGVASFTLLGKAKKGSSEMAFDANLAKGLALVFGALCCDGVYGPYQNKLVAKYAKETEQGVTAYHLMLNMNLWQGIFAAAICATDGEVGHAMEFIRENPTIIPPLVYFSAAMALGNVFIYQLQANYGALTVTLTTTVRKLISVILSVVMFGHSMAMAQWISVAIVFFSKNLADRLAAIISTQDTPAKPTTPKKEK
jgi:nucleoside diphosphate kinase